MTEEKSTPPETTPEPDIIDIAKKRTDELKNANEELDKQLKQHDRLIAESIVRGKSFAGQKEKTFQDEIDEEAEKLANAMGRSFKNLKWN